MEIASKYTYRIHGSAEWAPMLSDLPEAVQSHMFYLYICLFIYVVLISQGSSNHKSTRHNDTASARLTFEIKTSK